MLEVGFGAELGDPKERKLAAQKSPELLAKFQPVAAQSCVLAGRTPEIHQRERSRTLAEAFGREHQLSAALLRDSRYAAHQVAALVPGLQPQRAVGGLQGEVVRPRCGAAPRPARKARAPG